MNSYLGVVAITIQALAIINLTVIDQVFALAPFITVGDVRKAPVAISGDNTYIAWWTNDTGNEEVMFRTSNNGGSTFSDKVNLSNTTDAAASSVEIAAEGDNVVITW